MKSITLSGMELLVVFLALCSLSGLFLYGHAQVSPTYNVIDYGATATGGDDSRAFENTWRTACGDDGVRGVPTFYVPGGKKFVLKPITFWGPCKSSSIIVKLDGTLNAPRTLSGWGQCYENSWLVFSSITNLIVHGSGLIDGNGLIWWNTSSQQTIEVAMFRQGHSVNSCYRPAALRFSQCDNLVLRGLHHRNSPGNHISIDRCDGGTISHLNIDAPAWSPNTDGIDISSSSHLNINDLNIRTGDDCIAIKKNTYDINITRVTCGPGHGISIGSLGKSGSTTTVSGIHTRNCMFIGSQNGARIKTWQGGSGSITDILFEDIVLVGTKNPIVIDQFYCPHHKSGCETSPKNMKISGVTYNRFSGTSSTRDAIKFNCSRIGCSGIVMNRINIGSAEAGKQVAAVCQNAKGSYIDVTSPQPMCLL